MIRYLVFSLCSCSKEFEASDLVGDWKLTEAAISAGGPLSWSAIEDGTEITFFETGTFVSSQYSECSGGAYYTEESTLLLEYDCNGFEPTAENEDGISRVQTSLFYYVSNKRANLYGLL